jgi:hypothetical protein
MNLISPKEWSSPHQQVRRFLEDEMEAGQAKLRPGSAFWSSMVADEQLADEAYYMVILPEGVFKPYRAQNVEITTHADDVLPEPKGLVLLSSHRVSFSVVAVAAGLSVALLLDGDFMPLFASVTAMLCFGCLGYAQRLVQTKIDDALRLGDKPPRSM